MIIIPKRFIDVVNDEPNEYLPINFVDSDRIAYKYYMKHHPTQQDNGLFIYEKLICIYPTL